MSESFKKVVNKNDIFGGGSRFLYANSGTAKPTKLSEIYNPSTGVLAAGWNDFGATDGGLTVNRGYDKTDWEVDQVVGIIDQFITGCNVSLETSLAEASITNLQIAWEGGTTSVDVVESPNETTLPIGAPSSVTERMISFIVDKREVTGVKYVRAYVFWIAKFDGSDSSHSYNKSDKVLVPVKFALFPDTSETVERAFGIILDQVPA